MLSLKPVMGRRSAGDETPPAADAAVGPLPNARAADRVD
jgi:hypothetical protein